MNTLVNLLHKNGYSKSIINSLTFQTIDKLIKKNIEAVNDDLNIDSDDSYIELINENTDENKGIADISPFVLSVPYSEGFKKFKNSIMNITKNIPHFRLVSRSYKIINMFCNKSQTPKCLNSDLVYQFNCNGCDATYIGETARHLCTRVQEHSRLGNGSNIAEHNNKCKGGVDISNFKIICKNFNNYWERVLYEALMIRSHNPKINVQSTVSTKLLKVFN